jgi:hypothetical protein
MQKGRRERTMVNQEQLDRLLKQGVVAWNKWRVENVGVQIFLKAANLRGADLDGADLYDADLRGADLAGANLRNADLRNADLEDAIIEYTRIGNVDLSATKNLETVTHYGPSTIGIDTIYLSQGNIPEAFLKGAGVPDSFIKYMRSLVDNPIDYYSCFISVRLVSPKHAQAWGWAGKEYSFYN